MPNTCGFSFLRVWNLTSSAPNPAVLAGRAQERYNTLVSIMVIEYIIVAAVVLVAAAFVVLRIVRGVGWRDECGDGSCSCESASAGPANGRLGNRRELVQLNGQRGQAGD